MALLLVPGAVHVTASWRAVPAVTVGAAGASGAPAASVAEADHGVVPRSFWARSCTSYTVPFVRPVMLALRSVLVVAVGYVHVEAATVFQRRS